MRGLYKSQRLMRQMRRSALQRGHVAILDVGSTKIACMILRLSPDLKTEPIGVKDPGAFYDLFRVIGVCTTYSRGVRLGEITTMEETERAVRVAVQGAQKMAGVSVDHVIACFSGGTPRSFGIQGGTGLSGGPVTETDIARALAACDLPEEDGRRDAVHAMPVNFSVDERGGLTDPRGQRGRRLCADLHLVTVDNAAVENLLTCIKRCDLNLAGIACSSYASGLAALVDDEQELGSACIDMGGGCTTVSIFLKKQMIYADNVHQGGDVVTSDISKGLQISLDKAERIKTLLGGCVATGVDDREMIDVGAGPEEWDRDFRRISRADLIGVIRPRVEEVLEEIRAKMDAGGFGHLPSQRIVLTGGASQLPGLDRLAARMLGQHIRLGRPLRIAGLPQAASGPAFSACVGLSLHTAFPQDECWDFRMPTHARGRQFGRVVRWLREHW